MISLSRFLQFEEDIKNTFIQALKELGENSGWSVEFNVFLKNPQYSTDVDIAIKHKNRLVAIAEIKASDRLETFKNAKQQAFLIHMRIQCPYYMVITQNKWGLFGDKRKPILEENHLIQIKDIKDILGSIPKDSEFDESKWEKAIKDLIDKIAEINDDNIDTKRIAEAIRNLSEQRIIHSEDKHIIFPQKIEDEFFQALLPSIKEDELCRFSSFNSIFRTVSQKSHSMCSIIAMNDKSETSYVSDYFQEHGNLYPGASYLNSSDNWNRCFITSCCTISRANDFTMMRLYGDNAAGVTYKYRIDKNRLNNGFILKPVSYQRSNGDHPELDIIHSILAINVSGYVVSLQNLSIWQHFFKPKEYAFEEEVRLLYILPDNPDNSSGKIIWVLNSDFNVITPIITFPVADPNRILPLIIEEIILGPKLIERDNNLEQIKYLMKLNQIENYQNITVEISPISHYR